MKINEDDYRTVYDHLVKQRWEMGHEFVAFPTSDIVEDIGDLRFYDEAEAAQEHCFDSALYGDPYEFLSINSVYYSLSEGFQNPAMIVEEYGIVDVQAMVDARRERMKENSNINLNQNIMNPENLERVKDKVRYTGYEGLDTEVERVVLSGKPNVIKDLEHSKGYTVESVLSLNKSKKTGDYFFNSVKVSLKMGDDVVVHPQTFKIDNKFYPREDGAAKTYRPNYTKAEMINLLHGRAVKKDILRKVDDLEQWDSAWVQTNYKESDLQGNYKREEMPDFNLKEHLMKLPILEKDNEVHLNNLINSLERGNIQLATFVVNGEQQKGYIEANPRQDWLNTYDENLNRHSFTIESPKQDNSQNLDHKNDQNLNANDANVKKPGQDQNQLDNINNADKDLKNQQKSDAKKGKGQSI